MNRSNLLRIVSVLFIIWSIMNLLGVLGISSCAGLTSGLLFGSIFAGFALGTFFQLNRIVCYVFMLVAGISGLNARNKSLCKVCAWIIFISAIISFSGSLEAGKTVVASLISVALPLLYFIGVKKAF